MAGRLWPAAGASPDQAWVDLMATHHGTGVQTIDIGDPEGSRALINEWVSDQTNALIPELLPSGFINDGTEAAAANALGFEESGPPDPEFVVAADKPFFYLVRHVNTGAVLFAGQVTDPTA